MVKEEPRVSVTIYMPKDVKEKVTAAAAENDRSVSAQITFMLRQAVEGKKTK